MQLKKVHFSLINTRHKDCFDRTEDPLCKSLGSDNPFPCNYRPRRFSSVASPICQHGQEGYSEKTFPIFAFSSRFFSFFPDFPSLFPDFWQFFRGQGQSEETFPIFAFSSRFFLFIDFPPIFNFPPLFPDPPPFFPDFWQFCRCQGSAPPWAPGGYATA